MGGRGGGSGMSGNSLNAMGQKQLQDMTAKQREAVEYYGMNGQAMNEYLRDEDISMYGEYAEEIASNAEVLAEALNSASLPREINAYRGGTTYEMNNILRQTPGALQNPQLLVGKTYSNPGFLSTSTDRNYATEYADGMAGSANGVLYHVNFKRGANAVYTDPAYGKGGWENQVLGAPDIRFKITRAYRGRDGLLHVHMSGGN